MVGTDRKSSRQEVLHRVLGPLPWTDSRVRRKTYCSEFPVLVSSRGLKEENLLFLHRGTERSNRSKETIWNRTLLRTYKVPGGHGYLGETWTRRYIYRLHTVFQRVNRDFCLSLRCTQTSFIVNFLRILLIKTVYVGRYQNDIGVFKYTTFE